MATDTEMHVTRVEITTFGYLHGQPPRAHLTLDLRHHFRDPHVSPHLRYMTAELVEATARAVEAFAAGPSAGIVLVAVGCAGGRHRAATVGIALTRRLTASGFTAYLTHRDMGRPVVQRERGQSR
jgi:UPF0042 nucleotide-binding protein